MNIDPGILSGHPMPPKSVSQASQKESADKAVAVQQLEEEAAACKNAESALASGSARAEQFVLQAQLQLLPDDLIVEIDGEPIDGGTVATDADADANVDSPVNNDSNPKVGSPIQDGSVLSCRTHSGNSQSSVEGKL